LSTSLARFFGKRRRILEKIFRDSFVARFDLARNRSSGFNKPRAHALLRASSHRFSFIVSIAHARSSAVRWNCNASTAVKPCAEARLLCISVHRKRAKDALRIERERRAARSDRSTRK
jgi:hypothetical protein